MNWELVKVTEEPDWIQDESGVYVMIHRTLDFICGNGKIQQIVRLDLMSTGENPRPIRSWQGTAAAVRKAVMQWNHKRYPEISIEHASYIGEQLARAELLSDFVQD